MRPEPEQAGAGIDPAPRGWLTLLRIFVGLRMGVTFSCNIGKEKFECVEKGEDVLDAINGSGIDRFTAIGR